MLKSRRHESILLKNGAQQQRAGGKVVGQVSVPLRANADDAVLIISLLNRAQPMQRRCGTSV